MPNLLQVGFIRYRGQPLEEVWRFFDPNSWSLDRA
jgi:hypothetical protein